MSANQGGVNMNTNKNNLVSLVLLLVAILSALGLVFVWGVFPDQIYALYVLGALTGLSIGALIIVRRQDIIQRGSQRDVRLGAMAAINVLLIFVILVIANVFNNKHYWRVDVTKNKSNSISDETKKVISGLKTKVLLEAYLDPMGLIKSKSLLEQYQLSSKGKIELEIVDIAKNPARLMAKGLQKSGVVFVKSGAREITVENINEEQLSSALVKVEREGSSEICFTQDHGELSLQPSKEGNTPSIALFKDQLALKAIESRGIATLSSPDIPASCTAVAIVEPNSDFRPAEVAALKKYLENKGRLFVSMSFDKTTGKMLAPTLAALLKEWGVVIGEKVVFDTRLRVAGAQGFFATGNYSKDSPITSGLRFSDYLIYSFAASVESIPTPPTSLRYWKIARTAATGGATSNFLALAKGIRLESVERGEFGLVLAVEGSPNSAASAPNPTNPDDKNTTRLVVAGGGMMFSDEVAGVSVANRSVGVQSLAWLVNDESGVTIKAKDDVETPPTINEIQSKTVYFISFLIVPLVLIAAAIVIYLRRKKL